MPEIAIPENGRLADNVVHFARALRKAGLPVGPGRVVEAVRAVEVAGFDRREDFYHALAACFISKPEHRAVFATTFGLFWRDPDIMERMMAALMPQMRAPARDREKKAGEQRAMEAMMEGAKKPPAPPIEEEGEEIEIDARLAFSGDERLRARDFEQMSAAEAQAAKAAIARIELPVRPIASRRTRAAALGRIADWRGTLRRAMRTGEMRELARRERRERWPSLVALCDISGSMASYSRMLLHFLHAASNAKGAGWAKVHSFTFGTRLTNVSRHLHRRDADDALKRAGAEARDWEGGTRIGACLHAFNRDWSRRVMGQGAVVLLITDGLDRDDPDALAREAERLRLSARKVIWLNPLLRWDGFAPKARGVRALLPHVDSLRAAHNIGSIAALAEALTRPDDMGEKARLMRLLQEGEAP
jgi:uncharacterized protein with von Willebrand factor type A (vWA) domain